MILRFYCFIADSVLRIRYKNPMATDPDGGMPTFDIGVYEKVQDKMMRNTFLIGVGLGVIITTLLAAALLAIGNV